MALLTSKVTFAEDLGVEVVDIFVAEDKKRYVVHKKLLTAQSDYFSKALTGSFMEAEENSIHLKEEDPAAVALLIAWLYLDILPGTENLASPFDGGLFCPPKNIQIPVSAQGTAYPFVQTVLPNPTAGDNNQDCSQHICYQTQYNIFSPEELRLADYKLNRKYHSHLPTIAAPVPAPPQRQSPANLLSNHGSGSSLLAQGALQIAASQTAGSGLFGGATVSAASSPPATSQPIGSIFSPLASQLATSQAAGLFPRIAVNTASSQPLYTSLIRQTGSAPSSSSSASSGSQLSNSDANGSSAQANPSQQQNIFVARYGPVSQSPNSNVVVTPTSQSQNLFGRPTSSVTGGLFSSLQAPSSTISHIGRPTTSQPQTGSVFANLPSQPQTGGLFGSTSTSQSAGIFASPISTAGLPRVAVVGLLNAYRLQNGAPSAPSPPVNHPFTSQVLNLDDTVYLPPGAVMTTITPQKPKPGEFGYHPLLKPSTPGQFVPGISRAEPQEDRFIDMDKHQLALLNLAIMAEKFCWPKLFNVAMEAYIRGEHRLQRPISLDFIDRIYERTHEDSTLRVYALDRLSQTKSEGIEDLTPYMNMATKHSDFLADLLGKVLGSSIPKDFSEKTIQNYMYGRGSEEEEL